GKMGQEAINMIANNPNMQLVACIDRKYNGKNIRNISGISTIDAPIFTQPEECLSQIDAHILLDLTIPEIGYKHTKLALQHKVRPIVGTTGFTPDQIEELSNLAQQQKL